jgi:glycosyltransferase involved in cell wall biosynthesis
MRILVASHILPAPDAPHAGGQVLYHLLHELAARGHAVDLVSKRLPHESTAALDDVCTEVVTVEGGATPRQLAANIARTGLKQPRELVRWRGRRNNMLLAQRMDALLKRRSYDLVQLEFIQLLPLVQVAGGRAPVILSAHDLHAKLEYDRMRATQGWRWLPEAVRWRRTLRAELTGLEQCDAVAPLGAFDATLLRTLLPNKPLVRWPVWVPLGELLPPPPSARPRLLFVGALWRPVNDEAACWLVEAIWPRIQVRLPEAELVIAGADPSSALQAVVAQAHNVMLTGRVPDLTPYYVQSHAVIAPVQMSGGVLLKVLDALALGRPVVTTSAGNQGVGAQPGHDLLVADDAETLATAVVEVLQSPMLAAKLVHNGQRFVRATWDWKTNMDRYEAFIQRLARRS